jgi:hypothetical protein
VHGEEQERKKERLGKFETRSIEGISVGNADGSHAYRNYDKSNGYVEVSFDVEFFENNGLPSGKLLQVILVMGFFRKSSALWELGMSFPWRPMNLLINQMMENT